MNSGRMSDWTERARSHFLTEAAKQTRKFAEHIPLRSQLIPIILAFACSYALYGRISGAIEIDGVAFGGMLSFILLFAQMRLIDDLDDLECDNPGDKAGDLRMRTLLRQRLLISLSVCLVLIALFNYGHPQSMVAVVIATAINYVAPFGIKRHTSSMALGFIAFEGAPALIFAYIYFCWRESVGVEPLGLSAVIVVVTVFWAGYEFWKFSRKVHSDAMQPYLLKSGWIRLALNGFLVLALASNLLLCRIAGLSSIFTLYSFLLPAVFLLWMNLTWHITPRARAKVFSRQPPMWAGMNYVLALEAGLLLELTSIMLLR